MIIFTTCILLIHEYGRYFHLSLSWWFLNYIVCLSWRGVGFCQKPFLQLIRWLCSFVLQFVYLVNWRLRFIYDDFIFILLNHWKFYTMNFDQFYCVFSNFTKLYHLSHSTLCFFFLSPIESTSISDSQILLNGDLSQEHGLVIRLCTFRENWYFSPNNRNLTMTSQLEVELCTKLPIF